MATHVKVLGILHIVFGALGVLGALIVLIIFGGIAGLVGAADHSDDALIAVPILGGIGLFVFVLILVLSLPGLIAGWGLLYFQPWARILTIVLSCLDLINIPIGTALGVYGLWVLFSNEGQALFGARRSTVAMPR